MAGIDRCGIRHGTEGGGPRQSPRSRGTGRVADDCRRRVDRQKEMIVGLSFGLLSSSSTTFFVRIVIVRNIYIFLLPIKHTIYVTVLLYYMNNSANNKI